jgi:hypothetical protein
MPWALKLFVMTGHDIPNSTLLKFSNIYNEQLVNSVTASKEGRKEGRK